MPAQNPEECDMLFATHLNNRDLDGLVSLYEPEACLVQQDGTLACGADAIREGLASLLSIRPKIMMNVTKIVRAGDDLAVLYNDWYLTAQGADGNPTAMKGKAIEIVRLQRNGTWMFAVDDPFARG